VTTHIEHAVTEVIPETETSETGESGDTRWVEQEKMAAAMARKTRLKRRVHAEGLDD
jgi:hypothetical protein